MLKTMNQKYYHDNLQNSGNVSKAGQEMTSVYICLEYCGFI